MYNLNGMQQILRKYMGIKNDKGRALKILKILLVKFSLKRRATISLPVVQGYCISDHCLFIKYFNSRSFYTNNINNVNSGFRE